MVNVTIQDINDNCPMFVNLPYYAVVSVDAQKGDVITKVRRRFCYESEDI
jgi:protocadherin Fat 1/2/3